MILTKEDQDVLSTWNPPAGLIESTSNAEQITNYLASQGWLVTHNNLNAVVAVLQNKLAWTPGAEPATAPKPRRASTREQRLFELGLPVDPLLAGRSHAGREQEEGKEQQAKRESAKAAGVVARRAKEKAAAISKANSIVIEASDHSGRRNHAATNAAVAAELARIEKVYA